MGCHRGQARQPAGIRGVRKSQQVGTEDGGARREAAGGEMRHHRIRDAVARDIGRRGRRPNRRARHVRGQPSDTPAASQIVSLSASMRRRPSRSPIACMNSGSDLGASSPGSAITAERPFPMRREPLIARPSVSMRPLDLSVFTFSAMPYLRNVVIA